LTIRLPQDPIVSISDKFLINNMFTISHGPQFRPVGALLGGLSRPQPISDHFEECLELSWVAFQCLIILEWIKPLTLISYIPLTIISINNGFRGINYYH
jgi:hypothetical protein